MKLKIKLWIKRIFVFLFIGVMLFESVFFSNDVEVKAASNDSNYYRSLQISIAKGMQTSEMEELGYGNSIDVDSMRAISLFLSNFYTPYSTVLTKSGTLVDESDSKSNANSSTKTSEDENETSTTDDASTTGDASKYKKQMLKAMLELGAEDEIARAVVDGCVDATLDTAHELWIKKEDFDFVFNSKLNLRKMGLVKGPAPGITDMYTSGGGYKSDRSTSGAKLTFKDDSDAYAKACGTDGKYVKLTYGMFMGAMRCSKMTGSEANMMKNKDSYSDLAISGGGSGGSGSSGGTGNDEKGNGSTNEAEYNSWANNSKYDLGIQWTFMIKAKYIRKYNLGEVPEDADDDDEFPIVFDVFNGKASTGNKGGSYGIKLMWLSSDHTGSGYRPGELGLKYSSQPVKKGDEDGVVRGSIDDTTDDLYADSNTNFGIDDTNSNENSEEYTALLDDTSVPDTNAERKYIEFYWKDSGGTYTPVFSNSGACMEAYSLFCSDLDYKLGFGGCFTSLTEKELTKLIKKSSAQETFNKSFLPTLAFQQPIYVDWVGDLILYNGKKYYCMLPGCGNPYAISTITDRIDGNIEGNTGKDDNRQRYDVINAVNLRAINYLSDNVGKLVKVGGSSSSKSSSSSSDEEAYLGNDENLVADKLDASNLPSTAKDNKKNNKKNTTTNKGKSNKNKDKASKIVIDSIINQCVLQVYTGDDSLFSNDYYSTTVGSDNKAWDESLFPWAFGGAKVKDANGEERGTHDYITEAMDSTNIYKWNKGNLWDKDSIVFPNWKCLKHYFIDFSDTGASWSTFLPHYYFSGLLHMDSEKPLAVADAVEGLDVVDITDYANNSTDIDYNKTKEYGDVVTCDNSNGLLTDLFLTYAYAEFNSSSQNFEEKENLINLKFNKTILPAGTGNINLQEYMDDVMPEKVMSMAYYLLHPTLGVGYVATWFKNKISGILLRIHEDMVGGSDSNYTTGMTKYLGMEGYTTLPTLYDFSWIAKILDIYTNIIALLILIVIALEICYVLSGNITIQRAIVGVIGFTLLAFVPPLAINTVTGVVNKANDTIYNNKFDYWAMTQLETYASQLSGLETNSKSNKGVNGSSSTSRETTITDTDDIITAYNEDDLKNFQLDISSSIGGYGNRNGTGYAGVKLKWIAPKKFLGGKMISTAMDSTTASNTKAALLKSLTVNAVANKADGQEFVLDDPNALYVYRDYADIYRYASSSYNIYTTYNCGNILSNDINPIAKSRFTLDPKGAANTVGKNWNTSNFADLEYLRDIEMSNGMKLSTFIGSNLGSRSSSYGYNKVTFDISDTSSQTAIDRGFLIDVFHGNNENEGEDYDRSYESSQAYYQRNKTLATSLLANFANTVAEIQKGLERLRDADGDINDSITLGTLSEEDSDILYGVPLDSFPNTVQNLLALTNDAGFRNNTTKASDENIMLDDDNSDGGEEQYKLFSDYFYGLYSESPFYFLSFNLQDQMVNTTNYKFSYEERTASKGEFKNMLLQDNQSYFYNFNEDAGDGYGEMRDFMNMHDFFYYIMPMMKPSSDLVREFDDKYGMYTYDSCSLRFDSTGRFWYGGSQFDSLDGDNFQNAFADADAQEKYEFWHDWNVYTIMQAYAPWYDAMTDCRYAKPEQIEIGDEKFTVENPLDPTSYFSVDDNGDMTEGRFMVFSRSEMEYYGITWTNLTQVERNIILMQDNVYKEAIHLMNYYNLSDDVLIQAMAMLELFEFNKIFSQTIGTNYTLYPTGYELRAFTYDAYLRLILAEASGEDIATNPTSINGSNDYNRSIYSRIQQNTSILFSLTLIVNDFLAIYVIPVLRIIFLFSIFFTGILVLLAAVFGMEFNFVSVLTKSFLIPLCSFGFATLVLAYITSFLMSDGNSAVVGNDMTINIGDPTIALFVILFINAMVVVVYSKIVIKMFRDIKTLIKTFTNSIVGAVTGAFSNVVGSTLGRFGIAAGTGAGVYAFSNSRNRSGGDSAEGSTTKSRINNRGGIAGTNTKDSKDVTKDPKSQSENTNNAKKNNYNDKSDRFNGKTKVTENNANRVRQNESQNGENSYDSKAKSGNLSDVKTIKARQGEKNPVNEQNNRNNNKQSSNTQNNSNNGKNKNRGQRDPMFGVGYNKTKVDVNRKSKKK